MVLRICNYCGKHFGKAPSKNTKHNFCKRKHYFLFKKENPQKYKNKYRGGQPKFIKYVKKI